VPTDPTFDILFAPNPGRSGGPLKEVGSGGELSRLLLALSLVSLDPEVVAVFDEVDAGVGGETAAKLAEALADLAREHQVIVVTHLATIAAVASQHFVVEKSLRGGIAETRVREVAGEQRVKEVGRMLTGKPDDEETRRVARRLIEQGIKHRES
jgi:DNA repair protein RecN (Recombination protein N)